MDQPAPQQTPTVLAPIIVPARTAFGSLAFAMILGALIAISGLYMWGAQVAKERGASFGAEEAGAQEAGAGGSR